MACSKNNNLTDFRKLFKKLFGERTNIYSCIYFFASWKLYFKSDIVRKAKVLIAMNESLVQI